MKLWIRIDASLHRDPEVADLAARVGVKKAEAIGLLACVWGAMAEHRPSGNVSDISPATLEDWAEYEPRGKVKAGAFASAFLALFTDDGRVRGWKDRQGKLIERMEKDRIRKHGNAPETTEDSTDIPGNVHGDSAVTERNATEQNGTGQKDNKASPSPREALLEKLPEEYRDDLTGFLKSLGSLERQSSWIRNLDAVMVGMNEPPVKPEVVGAAIRQLVGNGERPNWNLFRGYLRTEARPPHQHTNGNRPGSGRPTDDVKGVAMLILGDLRKTRILATNSGHGVQYSISKSEVDALPPAASRALMAIGGAHQIANADDQRFSILISQFATAYAGAIAEEKSRLGAMQ